MVVGNGMIAKAFESYHHNEGFLIFASGVSNSTHADEAAFEKELNLIRDTMSKQEGKLFVYFSTCSIYDPSMLQTAYVQHKIKVENYITNHHTPFIIFRLTNPIGKTKNINTVVNYFIKNILEKNIFTVWKHASRNIIDMDDVYLVCDEILQQKLFTNSLVNIANPENYPISYIIDTIESHFKLKGNYNFLDKGAGPLIDISAIQPLFTKFNINFDENYLPELLQKYFPVK